MTTRILTQVATSISEFKANPMKAIASTNGEPIVVLNRNVPAFYCLTAQAYELAFKKSALKEWNKLGATVQYQFTHKLSSTY